MKKTLPKMKLNRETLHRLDESRLRHLAGGLDTRNQCGPLTQGTCNIGCASGPMFCQGTF